MLRVGSVWKWECGGPIKCSRAVSDSHSVVFVLVKRRALVEHRKEEFARSFHIAGVWCGTFSGNT